MSKPNSVSPQYGVGETHGSDSGVNPQPLAWFALRFGGIVLLLAVAVRAEGYFLGEAIVKELVEYVAIVVWTIVSLFDPTVMVSGNVISSRSASLRIVAECTGLDAMGLFAAATLAYNSGWRRKRLALAWGIPALAVVNLLRMVSLIWVGSHWPSALEYLHVWVWPALVVALCLGMWLYWVMGVEHEARAAA